MTHTRGASWREYMLTDEPGGFDRVLAHARARTAMESLERERDEPGVEPSTTSSSIVPRAPDTIPSPPPEHDHG